MRHPDSNTFGKCDSEIKVCLDENTTDAIAALAYQSDITKSEYVRQLLQAHVHGYGRVLKKQRQIGMPAKGHE